MCKFQTKIFIDKNHIACLIVAKMQHLLTEFIKKVHSYFEIVLVLFL
jgi:hypothetical protein